MNYSYFIFSFTESHSLKFQWLNVSGLCDLVGMAELNYVTDELVQPIFCGNQYIWNILKIGNVNALEISKYS